MDSGRSVDVRINSRVSESFHVSGHLQKSDREIEQMFAEGEEFLTTQLSYQHLPIIRRTGTA